MSVMSFLPNCVIMPNLFKIFKGLNTDKTLLNNKTFFFNFGENSFLLFFIIQSVILLVIYSGWNLSQDVFIIN